MLRSWRAERRKRDEQAVILAIGMLRPSRASLYLISRLARLSPGRTVVALARMEGDGRVVSMWAPGPPHLRRRVYRVAKAAMGNG